MWSVVGETLSESAKKPAMPDRADYTGPENATRGVMSVATPTTIPAESRAFLDRIMSCCTVL